MLLLAGYWLARSVDISWSVEISVAAVCTSMFKLLFCVGQNWVSRPLSADGAGAGSRRKIPTFFTCLFFIYHRGYFPKRARRFLSWQTWAVPSSRVSSWVLISRLVFVFFQQ